MIRFLPAALLLALCATLSQPLHARNRQYERPPKAVLIELLTRNGQVDFMRKHRPEKVAEVQKDIDGVMKATLADFSSNFEFCPVYFFVDTNAALIRAGHFEGVLLDAGMKPALQSDLKEGDTSFYIAYYGSLMPQPEDDAMTTRNSSDLGPFRESYGDDPTAVFPTLLVLDHNFKLLKLPRPRTVRNYISRGRSRYKKLSYRSRHFNIDYVPMAAAYDATIERYFAKMRRNREMSRYE